MYDFEIYFFKHTHNQKIIFKFKVQSFYTGSEIIEMCFRIVILVLYRFMFYFSEISIASNDKCFVLH